VCPGSYDPITNGHLDADHRACSPVQDEMVVAVVNRLVRQSKARGRGSRAGIEFIEDHAIAGDLERVPVGLRRAVFRRSWWECIAHARSGPKAIVKWVLPRR